MPVNYFYLYVLSAVIAALLFLRFLWRSFGPIEAELNSQLFEHDKRAFFGQLDIAVRGHLMVLPSLPVGDVLHCGKWGRSDAIANIRKNRRFDFVLYHRRKMKICCVINLIPHKGDANTKEFWVLRQLCEAADLPLLEFQMKPWRNVTELRKTVFAACAIVEQGSPDFELRAEEAKPQCPKCESSMTLRTMKKGVHAGQKWWVCNTYPKCRGARSANSVQS